MMIAQSTTNPREIETVVEYYRPSDRGFNYVIPNAQVVSFVVDSDEFDEIGDEVFAELAEHFCKINGLDLFQVFTSDAW
jgi:hypothetical protein